MKEKYIPLYRKYRPQRLEEIVGQEHIKKALTNAIELNKISHAYLFTGPRGTGKTSCARILAKSLNCVEGPTVTPCGKCESCEAITNSIPIDVIEIDAASNRKVEDAQNILEKIQYVPVSGKYKIYIIDEVHMLTTHAFNALLKTLEEPPENVIFILATTEPQKVLDTIKSRCQRFDFKRITTEDIVNHLKYLSKQEKINIEEDALINIARNSAGGMRDSIALLDQLSVLDSKKAITTDDINALLGRLSFDILNKLSEEIIHSNPENSIKILEEIYNNGNEPNLILSNLLNYFKNLLLAKNCPKTLLPELTQLNSNQIEKLILQVKELETQQLIFLIERTSYYIKEVKLTTTPYLWLEIAMIDLSNLAENTSLIELQKRITELEETGVSSKPVTIKTSIEAKPVNISKPQKITEPILTEPKIISEPVEQTKKEEKIKPEPEIHKEQPQSSNSNDLKDLWLALLKNIDEKNKGTAALLNQQGHPIELSNEKIVIGFKNDIFVKKMNTEDKKEVIRTAGKEFFNTPNLIVSIEIIAEESKKKIIEEKIKQPESKITEKEKPEIKNVTQPMPQKDETPELPKEEMASDQVKMIMTLFDGKYVN